MYAVSVNVEVPLTSEGVLKDAVTPVGSPPAESVTVPYPNDLICRGMDTVPAVDIAYFDT